MNLLKYKRERHKNFLQNVMVYFSVIVLIPVSLSLFFLFRTTIKIDIDDKNISEQAAILDVEKPKVTTEPINTEKSILTNARTFSLYQGQKQLPLLKRVELLPNIEIKDYNSLVNWLLTNLVDWKNQRLLSTDKPLRAVYVYEEQLVIDLNIDILEIFQKSRLQEIQILYAITNSLLINLPYDRLRILFGGKNPEPHESAFCFARELRFNPQLNIQSNETK